MLKNFESASRPDKIFEKIIEQLAEKLYGNAKPRYIGASFDNMCFDTPVFVPLRKPEQNTFSTMASGNILNLYLIKLF